jgi:hypothetical protein
MPAMTRTTLVALPFLLTASAALAGTVRSTNPDNGLSNWESTDAPFSLQLLQLMPDNLRALYSNKGFPPDLVEEIAGYCVFGSVARNLSNQALDYDVADWHAVTADGVKHTPRTKTEWLAIWRSRGVDYGWSILPAAQTFGPGDWAQGFVTIKLPRDTRFNFDYSWRQNGQTFHATLEGVQCAPERLPARPRQP